MAVELHLHDIRKTFVKDGASFNAVERVELDVKGGELVTFLGPSGCGKTTTLRMVAGFETPTAGRILIDGQDVTNVMVNKREIGFVFQNYALFPHMTIGDNVGYGLKMRSESGPDVTRKVAEALEMVGLKGAEKRYPNQLSGGEQQRVALARVLVMRPKVLLMDEPLSNLDAKLRLHMRTEIRRIQKQLDITCLYVTHDQKEALTMADRIMVMNRGRVEQIGTPFDIYTHPRTLFVADFIGQANALPGTLEAAESPERGVMAAGGAKFPVKLFDDMEYKTGGTIRLILRPEAVTLKSPDEGLLRGCVDTPHPAPRGRHAQLAGRWAAARPRRKRGIQRRPHGIRRGSQKRRKALRHGKLLPRGDAARSGRKRRPLLQLRAHDSASGKGLDAAARASRIRETVKKSPRLKAAGIFCILRKLRNFYCAAAGFCAGPAAADCFASASRSAFFIAQRKPATCAPKVTIHDTG